MQPNVNDVYTQQAFKNLPTIDPRLIQQQARGLAAAGELQDMHQGPMMANALRMQNQEAPGVVGQGFAAQGPTMLQSLAHMATTRAGENQMRDLSSQAKALRGESDDGRMAALQAQTQQDQINRQQQLSIAEAQAADRAARDDEAKWTLRENFEPWVNEQGDIKNMATTRGKGIVDEDMKPTSAEGYKPLGRNSVLGGIGSKINQKEAAKAYATMRNLNDIKTTVSSLTDDDFKTMNRPLLNVALNMAPADLKTYIRENKLTLTPTAKRFLTQMAYADAKLRHELFGAALTRLESSKSGEFLPGAAGLMVADSVNKMEAIAKTHYNTLAGIEDSEFMKPGTLTSRVEYQFPESLMAKPPGQATPTESGAAPAVQRDPRHDEYMSTKVNYAMDELMKMSGAELRELDRIMEYQTRFGGK